MDIKIYGNVTNVTNFDGNSVQNNFFNSSENLNNMYNDLEKLKPYANDEEKIEIANAQECITNKNESKFIKSLKKLLPFIEKVASSVTASVIVAYMKENGLVV